ncbi:hypothetical protein GGQ73_003632 [Rhizobium skierniewicense]|uniref:Uncharacterized protein n=1 Tax=Rhizobium skierniewicense TaxID=984260 RepID=A0A7W6CAS9_9HYPH|nr:hypothetical protein [Rhizobium skierniewicense]MBB3947664.1 hypothetical protein [Rhizobium skierniewicense]
MAASRYIEDWVDEPTRNLLDELVYADLDSDKYAGHARLSGRAVAAHYLRKRSVPDRFHVVSAVEDFDNFAAGVIRELELNGALVRYSCIWPQRRVINEAKQREVSPIYQAFRQEEWLAPYQLLFAVSNIGTIARIKSCMVHTAIDEKMDNGDYLDILCGSCHESVPLRLAAALPESLSERCRIVSLAWDYTIDSDGFSVPGVGGNPAVRSGVGTGLNRENFIPDTVRNDFQLRASGLEI